MEERIHSRNKILSEIMHENKLDKEGLLYRFTSDKYLKHSEDGSEYIIANDAPQEMVIDKYDGQGHVFIAKDIGPGLTFMTEPLEEYVREDRVCVSVKIADILDQGGLIYSVTSLPAYITAYFVTLPKKELPIKKL